MKKRIGLFTPKKGRIKKGEATTTTSVVEVATLPELTAKLAELGAKRVGLLHRDRVGTTRLEGAMMAPADLKPEHLDWLTAASGQFETRGLFFE